jgi:peptide/nickel transport system substrate-binding protein
MIELEKGTIDLMDGIEIADLARLKKERPEIRCIRRGYRAMDFIGWNRKIDLFSSPKIRRALALAIDRDMLMRALLSSGGEIYGKPCVGTITPELCKEYNSQIVPLPYDPAEARRLFEEEGWKDSDGDGVLENKGRKFEFRLITNTGNARREKASIIVQEQLKKAGVKVELSPLETQQFIQKQMQRDFEACLSGWGAGLVVDPSTFWHSGDQYKFNIVSYANPRVDELIDRGIREADSEKARGIWAELQRIIYEDQPYAFLYWREDYSAIHNRFRNVGTNILSVVNGVENWWVPANERKY